MERLRLAWQILALIFLIVTFVSPRLALAQQIPPASSSNTQEQTGSTVPRGKKLVMKDGTFQIVTSYEVKGDRVRYYSVERSEWEEMPASMVDWDATKEAEQTEQNQQHELVAKVKKEEAEAKAAAIDVDASLEVAPHVFLPPGEGIFLLDGHAIFPLVQSEASNKLNKGRFIEQVLMPVPILPSRRTVYLDGRKAAFRIRNQNPEFYLRTTDPVMPEIELIEVKVRGKRRQIENVDSLFGETQEKRNTILMQQWQIGQGVYRFTLGQSLKPGEYALAESTTKEGMNLMVWDFGVDPPLNGAAKKEK